MAEHYTQSKDYENGMKCYMEALHQNDGDTEVNILLNTLLEPSFSLFILLCVMVFMFLNIVQYSNYVKGSREFFCIIRFCHICYVGIVYVKCILCIIL